MPTYVEGFNFGNLFSGMVLTILGFIAVLGIVGGAYSTGFAVLAAQSSANSIIPVSFSSVATATSGTDSLAVTPGPVLGALCIVFSFLSCVLLLIVWFGFGWVRELPGFGPPLCDCNRPTMHRVISGVSESTHTVFPAVVLPVQKNVGVVLAPQPPLPPSWSKVFDSNTGDYYYFNSSTGASTWDFNEVK
jgi:hypothetical protein